MIMKIFCAIQISYFVTCIVKVEHSPLGSVTDASQKSGTAGMFKMALSSLSPTKTVT